MTRISVRIAVFALLFVANSAAAQAVVLNPTGRGWYTDLGVHHTDNPNYAAGYCASGDCGPLGEGTLYHDFFTFDFSGVSGHVTSALLDLETRLSPSPDVSETFELHEVTTSAFSLDSSTSSAAIFTDLGDGPLYASVVSPIPTNLYLDAEFNPTGLAAVNAALGSFFSVGGQISTLNPRGSGFAEMLFLTSGIPPANVSLVLNIARCPAAPASGCNVAGKAQVKIKSTGVPAKSSLAWSWNSDAITGDFGDPTTHTAYALCFYKDGALSLSSIVAENEGWTGPAPGKPAKFKYKNKTANDDGIVGVQVAVASSGKAKIKVKAKGAKLTLPALPYQPTQLTVQLLPDSGTSTTTCWESTFTSPYVQDDMTGFIAK